MPIQNASIGLAVALREDVADSSDLWDRLLMSAEQVLRGGEVEGPFASIADHVIRRRLASELMLGDCDLDEGWRRMFLCYSSTKNLGLLPRVAHVVDFPEPPSFMREDAEDALPRCSVRYLQSCSPGSTENRNRHQAAAAFPHLVRLAIHVAHSEQRWPRVLSAWRVIDAIDDGHSLILALREFLQLGKAEIRVSRTLPALPSRFGGAWSITRRLLRTIVLLPIDARPRPSASWNRDYQYFPLLRIFARVSSAPIASFMTVFPKLAYEFSLLKDHPEIESRRLLKLFVTEVREKSSGVVKGWSQLKLFRRWSMDTEYRDRQRCTSVSVCSKKGWLLKSIVSLAELSREGHEMEHCVADAHHLDLLSGNAMLFSIRSAESSERLTMLVMPNLKDESCTIELAGPRNTPIHPSALRAALELFELIYPDTKIKGCLIH